ncbi:hypothetical protein G7Y89_g10456 [Cudoniella acicularis]|uniref:D-lactate dehydrogenase (cytochrome) n=1 Tax=Cudoniella acicularis TaxID=354080 RepID=A0A8H4RCQ5_9HELO|nr:hypothetical protein G7Y89_g10456 [Cudoniella acicularis]
MSPVECVRYRGMAFGQGAMLRPQVQLHTHRDDVFILDDQKYPDKLTMLKAARLIAKELGGEKVSFDDDNIEAHGHFEWSTSNTSARPVAIVTPKKVPMVPFGAGSSVEGNCSSPFSGICIDLSLMNKIVAFHEDDMDVVVEAGVNWVDLNNKIKSSGLFLPLDPSPSAHIGGMVATNCSGTNAMRYGTMKDWVVNLTVVLANGEIIKTRRRPRKTSAGYNLTTLFTGSEGTLGIITEITLKLAIIPQDFSVAIATFPTIKDAATAASRMMREGVPLAALELMDEIQMKLINQNGGAGGKLWAEKPTLFLKFSGTRRNIDENISRVKIISKSSKGIQFDSASTEKEMTNLWAARKEVLYANLAARPEGTQIWSTDVAVPLSRMAEIIGKFFLQDLILCWPFRLSSSVLGHVGDGNFHQIVMYNPDKPQEAEAVKRCVHNMMISALEMEGTVSGEHGIGMGKKQECLLEELGPGTIAVMKGLKRSLDPLWLLNPGKVFDEK